MFQWLLSVGVLCALACGIRIIEVPIEIVKSIAIAIAAVLLFFIFFPSFMVYGKIIDLAGYLGFSYFQHFLVK
jgi:hypothetical protein